MAIVSIPKKLRDAFVAIRSGDVDKGLSLMDGVKGFDAQKSVALAEIAYFREDYESAMSHDETALPCDGQWYAGNVVTEHLLAYTSAALVSKNIPRAKAFYTHYLDIKKKDKSVPEHTLKVCRYQVTQHLLKLEKKKSKIDPDPLKPLKKGKTLDAFNEQLRIYRPKLTLESPEGADYILFFMFEGYPTNDALAYYSKYASRLKCADHHLQAARLFAQCDSPDGSRDAMMLFAKGTAPVEHMQVTPMRLFEFTELHKVMTRDFKERILTTSKMS